MIKSNTKPLLVKVYFAPLKQKTNLSGNTVNEVYVYVSHVRRSQNTEHAKVLRYFTNKWKTRFDYRKSLNKKISLNTLFLIELKIYFSIQNKIRLEIKKF